MENTDVKEIRELVAPDNEQKLEISLKVAELPTTTPIEVSTISRIINFIDYVILMREASLTINRRT